MAQIKLSGILNMIGDFDSIRPTLRALNAQTARQDFELIIVALSTKAATIDPEQLKDLGAYQIVQVESLPSGVHGWSKGILVAQAPIVVMCEDHSFPASNWAQTLIDAHNEGDYFAVCPAITNGNPRTRTSWANFILSFVEWFSPDESKPVISGAGHNTSYKRELLLADYGGNLENWLNPERMMHLDLAARGKKILLDARTSTAHVNISQPAGYFGMSYCGGRVFGGSRAANWPMSRKLFYAVLFPLVPFIRLRRLLPYFNTPQKRRDARLLSTLPLIMIGLFCHAFGEAVGYLAGNESITRAYTNYELNRSNYVTSAELAEIWGGSGRSS